MRRFNLLTAAYDYPADNPDGYRRGQARVGEAIGSRRIGGTVYELPPGESAWPYHYELGDEEWMIVLDGRVAVRTPEGEQELARGDVVCFPEGPDGAHKMVNRAAETAHVLMLSTRRAPGGRGLPRQRQGRGLHGRPGRGRHGAAVEHRGLLGRGES